MTLGENENDPAPLDPPFTDTPTDTAPKRGRGRPKKNLGAAFAQEIFTPRDKAPKTVKSSAPKWNKEADVAKALETTFGAISFGVSLLNQADGAAIDQGSPALINALIDLARTDHKFRKYLESFAAPGKYGPLVIAFGGIALPIAANHGLFNMFSKKDTDNLEPTDSPNPEVTHVP
jgi:hypothetical protein